jgi:DNA-binding winged helix-turn-helix (wHTH) protein
MGGSTMVEQKHHFGGGFHLDIARRELRRGKRLINLKGRPLEILIYLIQHPDEFLNEKTFKDAFNVSIDWGTLKGYISTVREALDDRKDKRIICTVTGRGYKFVAEIFETKKPSGTSVTIKKETSTNIHAPVIAQKVKWGRNDGLPAGIRVWDARGNMEIGLDFIPWLHLYEEIKRNLLPQVLADPTGFDFELHNHNGKTDWLLFLVDGNRSWYCDVWFGGNPDDHWTIDGLVRLGDRDSNPRAWQTWQRHSDGTYLRVPGKSLCNSLDKMKSLHERVPDFV